MSSAAVSASLTLTTSDCAYLLRNQQADKRGGEKAETYSCKLRRLRCLLKNCMSVRVSSSPCNIASVLPATVSMQQSIFVSAAEELGDRDAPGERQCVSNCDHARAFEVAETSRSPNVNKIGVLLHIVEGRGGGGAPHMLMMPPMVTQPMDSAAPRATVPPCEKPSMKMFRSA